MSGDVPAGVEAIRHYVAMRDAKPLRQLDDVIHSVHAGTEWEAELRLSDLRLAATPTPPIEGRDADVERVEVVARAIAGWTPNVTCWEDTCEKRGDGVKLQAIYRQRARAAIAALQALGERG